MPLQHAILKKLKKQHKKTDWKSQVGGEEVGKVQKVCVCLCVSVMEEKLQLDLRLPDLTRENDTDCSVRKQ